MNNNPSLTLGEKLMHVRKARGYSQENVAHALGKNRFFYQRIENEQTECDAETLAAIRKFLDIENAPLLGHELKFFKSQLWMIHDLLNADRYPEAEALFQKLSPILDLPFESDLQLLYTMFEIRMLLIEAGNKQMEEKRNIAEEKLKSVESLIDFNTASDEVLQLFHCIKGSLCARKRDYMGRIKHFLKAIDHTTDNMPIDARLYFYIGSSYISLGKPFKAMVYLEYSKMLDRNNTSRYANHTNINIALACMCTGAYKKAEKLLTESLIYAESINSEQSKKTILLYLGSLYNTTKQYEKSISFFDQAIAYANNDRRAVVSILCLKANSLCKLKKINEFHAVLAQARKSANGDEHYAIMIETESHCMTLDNSDSLHYLENIAIPYMMKSKGVSALNAIGICKDIEAHYLKKRSKMKALTMAATMRDIYEEAFFWDDDLE